MFTCLAMASWFVAGWLMAGAYRQWRNRETANRGDRFYTVTTADRETFHVIARNPREASSQVSQDGSTVTAVRLL